MVLNSKILRTSTIVFILLTFYVAYFKYFPVFISSLVTNIIIISVTTILVLFLIYQPFLIRKNQDLYLLLPQYLLFAFITRAIPTLRFNYQPLSDPYYYFICTLNIIRYGTLDPILSWWYGLIPQQLTWPNLHILGANLVDITGIQAIDLLRYQEPILGTVFFLGVFILAKLVTENYTISILSGLFASTGDTILFYQSEYHPQGLAFIYCIFLLIFIVDFLISPTVIKGFLLILYSCTLSLSHHFSSLYLGLLFCYMGIICIIYIILSYYTKLNLIRDVSTQIIIWTMVAILMIYNHIFNYPSFIIIVKTLMQSKEYTPSKQIITTAIDIPFQVPLLNSTKYLLLFLVMISIFYILKTKDRKEILCAFLMFGILISGIIGTFITFAPVDRLIGFYLPLASIFASLTLWRFRYVWIKHLNTSVKFTLILFISLIIIIAGPFNFFAPGLILHDTPKDPYYWHSNDFSDFSTSGMPGMWAKDHCLKSSSFSLSGNFVMSTYFHGELPFANINIVKNSETHNNYIFTNKYNMDQYPYDSDNIYSTGRFVINTY